LQAWTIKDSHLYTIMNIFSSRLVRTNKVLKRN
jgi:hypothetical protein